MDVRNTYCRRIERNRNIALCLDLAKALISARARAALLSLETTSKSPSDSKLLLSNIEKMLRKAMQTCIIGYFENFRFDLLPAKIIYKLDDTSKMSSKWVLKFCVC